MSEGIRKDMKTVSWFSAGVSSAVATKLAIDRIDEILFIDIDDHHEDSKRFLNDCQEWFGKEIITIRSIYKNVEEACLAASYVNGVAGAPCTRFLKRRVRLEWEKKQDDLRYVWGMDYSKRERERADRLLDTMPKQKHIFPLIENKLSKEQAHEILTASGIKRPVMYDLGYHNNNCLGCVKGGRGYWNRIRIDFPAVFKQRAEMERNIGASCINGTFLDELDPDIGRHGDPIVGDCGILCEVMGLT